MAEEINNNPTSQDVVKELTKEGGVLKDKTDSFDSNAIENIKNDTSEKLSTLKNFINQIKGKESSEKINRLNQLMEDIDSVSGLVGIDEQDKNDLTKSIKNEIANEAKKSGTDTGFILNQSSNISSEPQTSVVETKTNGKLNWLQKFLAISAVFGFENNPLDILNSTENLEKEYKNLDVFKGLGDFEMDFAKLKPFYQEMQSKGVDICASDFWSNVFSGKKVQFKPKKEGAELIEITMPTVAGKVDSDGKITEDFYSSLNSINTGNKKDDVLNTNNGSQNSESGTETCSPKKFIRPTPGAITSEYGMRFHPTRKVNALHTGIDIGADSGTSIKAAGKGMVEVAGDGGGYGNYVIVNHGNGYKTLYAHMSSISVQKGDNINQGQELGKVGSTGNSTGPHLHFEIKKDDATINPRDYIKDL
ncbi:MAG: peptidoglycan DD-metalloendopeptidase family protein [Candidatus Gracilibacteria bacterium]|nr:peptidoglycan DD-metalloendopeptidase family protein [Candidatus Gracilibacteria bacterium]